MNDSRIGAVVTGAPARIQVRARRALRRRGHEGRHGDVERRRSRAPRTVSAGSDVLATESTRCRARRRLAAETYQTLAPPVLQRPAWPSRRRARHARRLAMVIA
jgi:hypothetical protein